MTANTNTAVSAAFAVGDYVSYGYGSDSYPAEVVRVSPSGKEIETRQLSVMRLSGSDMTGDKNYVVASNENGGRRVWTLRKNNRWVPKGLGLWDGPGFGRGVRDYRDPSF